MMGELLCLPVSRGRVEGTWMQVAECPLVDELRLWAVQRLLRKPGTFVTDLTVHASCPAHACSPERCPGCSCSVPQPPVLPATLPTQSLTEETGLIS